MTCNALRAGFVALASFLSLALATPAHAQSGARATVTLAPYELDDMDTFDGVTPWLTWENGMTGPMQASSSAGIWGSASDAYDTRRFHFILSPHTTVYLVAFADLATLGPDPRASAEMMSMLAGADFGSHDEAWVWEGDSGQHRLVNVLTNEGATALQGWVDIVATSNTWGAAVPAVPEPATSAMLLGGAALLMVAGRRRRF